MTVLKNLHNSLADRAGGLDALLPILARFLFAAILLVYFWKSGLTKLGEGFAGLFSPSLGAYAQIFPKAIEAAFNTTTTITTKRWDYPQKSLVFACCC